MVLRKQAHDNNEGPGGITISTTSSIMLQDGGIEASSNTSEYRTPMITPNTVAVHISGALSGTGMGMGSPMVPIGGGGGGGSAPVNNSSMASVPKTSKYAEMIGHKNMSVLEACGKREGLLQALQSDATAGITTVSVGGRRATYGANQLPPVERLTLWEFVKESLEDKTMQVLIGAAVISLILGMTTPDPRTGEVDRTTGWIEGFAILVSIVIVTIVSSLNNYQKQEQFTELMEEGNRLAPVSVHRDGEWHQVADEEVVVGDIVEVGLGMQLSFDAVLLDGEGIVCDESSLTGERGEVHKDVECDPFLISGTNVIDGAEATALVVAVGEQSFAGSIAMAVREGKKNTPLQEQLEEMADIIGKFGLAAAIFTFAVLFLKELYVMFIKGGAFYAMKLFENITTAVAIVVVAVPEGLPLSVTISLAYSMKRMLSDGNLVRHLAACETMGGATVVCSDKTGTITEPNMKLTTIHLEGKTVTCPGSFHGADPLTLVNAGCSEAGIKLFLDGIAYADGGRHCRGNKTSEALSAICNHSQKTSAQAIAPYDAITPVEHLDHSTYRRFPFSSMRKQSSMVVKQGDKLVHYVCGAAEIVLQQCNMYLGTNGVRHPLTAEMRKHNENVILDLTRNKGLRTLCVAFSEKNTGGFAEVPYQAPTDVLTLIGITGLEEPIRHDVIDAVRSCRRAGMSVMMLTGDNLATATTIAHRCGILEEHSVTMDGPTFRSLSDADILRDVLPNLAVLARATPLDKQRVVSLLKADANQVVAVTGDGTNDAPALKAADVGFSMNSGSDVAKRASDIVLLNDNFAGMVKAAMWGRNVRDNIRKFLQFQLTVNLAACIVAFCGAVMNNQNLSPLKPVQLLWLNLIMDTLAALALATELPCEKVLLSRPPEAKDSPIINRSMWVNIIIQSGFQLLVQIFLLAHSHKTFGLPFFGEVHLTIVFNTFVLLQVFNFFNARLLHHDAHVWDNLGQSTALIKIVIVIVVIQLVMIEHGGRFMATTPLTVNQWIYCTMIGSLSLAVGSLSRWVTRRQQLSGRKDGFPFAFGWLRRVNVMNLKKS